MNYDQLFSFVVFSERLSFTRAAEALHLSQPALHVQIRKLSEDVGRPLYRRRGRALSLTPEGQRLAAFGRQVRDQGRSFLDELRGAGPPGPAVLASGQGAFLYLLGPAIRRFLRERWPLRLSTVRGPEALEAVREARAHVGVLAADAPPADLESVPLRAVGQVAVVPAGHRLARSRRVRPSDLAGERIVVAPSGSPHRSMLAQALSAAGARWEAAVEATGWELMLHFARLGLGIAVVNDFCPAPRGMVAVPLEGVPTITYYAVRRDGPRSREAEALHRIVLEAAS